MDTATDGSREREQNKRNNAEGERAFHGLLGKTKQKAGMCLRCAAIMYRGAAGRREGTCLARCQAQMRSGAAAARRRCGLQKVLTFHTSHAA